MGRMRAAALLLLLALQCLDRVWALKCHSCLPDAETCAGPIQCAPEHKACLNHKQTTIEKQTMINYTQVIKTCVPSCLNIGHVPSREDNISGILEFSSHVSCCTTDLCNAAPGRGLGAATVAMMLLAPVLAALLGDFL